jgi:predicted AAA+ superfamily ATPase
MAAYLARLADQVLEKKLRSSGAVLLEGPKWCGKTWTASQKAQSVVYLQDPDHAQEYMDMAAVKPSLLLQGETPRLLDEWQMVPVLWDAVRFAVDNAGKAGLFILTGSSVPSDLTVSHTGTGRISRMLMRPMSLFESLDSKGTVRLSDLFSGTAPVEGVSNLPLERLVFCIARGGWPASVREPDEVALDRARDYADAVIQQDMGRMDGIERNPSRVRGLMQSVARNISTPASMTTLRKDIARDDESFSEKTISSYLNALRRMYVVEDLEAWSPALRSSTAIRTSPTRHFVDPSIACAVLRARPNDLLHDFRTLGFLFESLCIRDLRIYSQSLDGEVYHYRDRNGLEADAIIHLNDGRWAAAEVKLGARMVDEAARNLIKLRETVDVEKMNKPSFLLVLTGDKYAYRREDGVYVVPLACLRD